MATAPAPGSRVLVVAAVLQRGEHLLVCQRGPGGRHAGLWEFPGGKVRPGESEAQALGRELTEELALADVAAVACLFEARDPDTPYVLHFWSCTSAGEPRALEHQALRWCTIAEVLALPLAPADRRFADAVLAARR